MGLSLTSTHSETPNLWGWDPQPMGLSPPTYGAEPHLNPFRAPPTYGAVPHPDPL